MSKQYKQRHKTKRGILKIKKNKVEINIFESVLKRFPCYEKMKIKTDKNKNSNNLCCFHSILATAFPVPERLKLMSQKLVVAKILNKCPFLEVEVVGAY